MTIKFVRTGQGRDERKTRIKIKEKINTIKEESKP